MQYENTVEGCPKMEVSHRPTDKPTPHDVWTVLQDLPQRVNTLLKKYEPSNAGGFEDFELELHALLTHAECAVTEEALARHDVDLPLVFIDGQRHRRACRCEKTYLSAAGEVTVKRTLYRARRGERAVAALERTVGIVEGYWTPLAARHSAVLVSHLTPREAEEVLVTLGNMSPSKSSLDRLPKALSARWEAQREDFGTTVREATVEAPDEARAVVGSLDGVMAPMCGGYRKAACKTLVTERHKRSDMRWRARRASHSDPALARPKPPLRAYLDFARANVTYRTPVSYPDNVVPFRCAHIH